MNETNSDLAQQLAHLASRFQEQRTGHAPKAVNVVLGDDTLMGEDPQLATIPVMVLTAHHESDALRRVARFPVSSFHLKPLAPDRLAAKLRTLVAHPRQRFGLAVQTGRLESAIAKRTGGRVENLRVETIDGRIIVSGRSNSHHVKQLALAAVREAFAASESQSVRIEVNIIEID